MFAEIVFSGGLPGALDRDDIEEALTEALGADGEVTGAGVGVQTCNLDVESAGPVDAGTFLRTIAETLVNLGVGEIARLNLGHGERVRPRDLIR